MHRMCGSHGTKNVANLEDCMQCTPADVDTEDLPDGESIGVIDD